MNKERKRNQGRNRWAHQRSWCIYTSAMKIRQPFPLERLQDAIRKKTMVWPRASTILGEIHAFYKEYHIPLIVQEPDSGLFIANPDIDLRKTSHRAIIQPPRAVEGPPFKNYCRAPDYWQRYRRNAERLKAHPEEFLGLVFPSMKKERSADDIVDCLPEFVEGAHFGSKFIKNLMSRYITKHRGPPYFREVGPSLYRRVSKPTARKYFSGGIV